ncbi:YggT family protein [Psychrobacillus antarcticus]|uniref:YggT family protein n=1 Tax=Psychrobacillus antarcticus TaxID=2879115 RepID=UPI002408546A|nr:YggT family protein [Psychrobacillus antarcticus]
MGLVLYLISWGVQIYTYALIAYILMSWVPSIQQSGFGKFLGRICEPYLEPFRKIIPPLGMIDISPIVAIFVLNLAMKGIYYLANIVT